MFILVLAAWLLCASQSTFVFAQTNLRQAASELQPQLSKGAIVTFPFNSRWEALQVRGASPRVSPDYSVIVEVATEADVQTIVTFANRLNIPFLAVSGTHGWTKTLNKMPYGIQINMRKLNTTILSRDGKTATVGGGTLQYEITRSLFAKGRYAVTALAECVSVAGPLLGGGHSLLQGQHGYVLDNLVSARVVLASGKSVEASRTKNADLFWALQGAGHNFGILTSFVVKTYNIPSDWTVYSLVYTTDKLEALFSLINEFETSSNHRPSKLALTGVFVRIPGIDPNNPVIAYTVAYEGSETDAEPYAARFKALGPASVSVSTRVNYVELYTVTGNNLGSQACIRNNNILGAGTSLPAWDLEGTRKAFTVFGNLTTDSRFSTSITLLENYGMEGVRKVSPELTALAPEERNYPVLASPILWWDGDDEQTTKDAYAYANAMRDAMYSGVDRNKYKRHCYVNYANGEETKPEMYGYESWRMQRLAKLKAEWDPMNKFGFYNPIV
ncbi:FAD-binding domain-containing protein [Dothidotthia symphoricarpi CBS 119687]|uniref:FAD-binding domain-containing protein n=1 Tax=Dothidotthia symphoricarpi CBS 119687 TaxID=1392245 RepID=A0A6A5ZXK1_9PLEO|nr:FAD-binding domain-containing protein [Dothidotthia symphoricarpi CBS 119687]KAF2124492.1 FAD-binding domain-containing protein [Dothidotthia symphoricarpi CBS 119687]